MSTEISPLKVRKFGSIALLTLFCNCSFMYALRRWVNKFYCAGLLRYPNWGAIFQRAIQQNQHQHYMCIELRMSYLRPYHPRCCDPEDTFTLQYVETICLTFVYLISHQLFGLELRCRPPAFMSISELGGCTAVHYVHCVHCCALFPGHPCTVSDTSFQ